MANQDPKKIEEFSGGLYDTTFLLGRFRRRAAIRRLIVAPNSTDIVLLAEALARNHPDSAMIIDLLQRLTSDRDPDKVVALWIAWGQAPQPALATVLARLGWPASRSLEVKVARAMLMLASVGATPEILHTVAVLARSLPVNDEGWNDEIYATWVRSQSDEFERVINEQQRQPGSPTLEALHALVTGAIARYTALNDEDGAILAQAFLMAPPAFRDRMARTVANNPDRKLKEAYRRALSGGGMDDTRMIANLKLVGDEDGLFEKVRFLRLGAVLELCDYWANHPGRPSRPKLAEVVDRAVTAYHALMKLQTKSPPPPPVLPDGLMDIFDYWRQQPFSNESEVDFHSKNPSYKAHGLYLGYKRGAVNRQLLRNAAYSPHWLERLVARLLDSHTLAKAKEDHVCWVSVCAGEAAMLQIPIAGTPEDYRRHGDLLQRSNETSRTHVLLEILCAFQGAFVASGISVDEIDDAVEPGAIEIEEADEEF
ncbi:conserved hypothetical protein [Gammaproteobacteria bacterium]